MDTFALKYSTGTTETFETYEAALAAARSVYTHAVVGHSGDIADGGERTLIWPSEELAENDDGSCACASIQVRHESVT